MRTTRRTRPVRIEQLALFPVRGGRRDGAGRKPKGERPLVAHAARPRVRPRDPVFVTTKLVKGLPNLRRDRTLALLRKTLAAGSDRFGFRLVEYSIQSDHLHFVVEAQDQHALGRGMKGLLVRLAKALNRAWERTGRVVRDRYHARVLTSPREVRNVLLYTLHNAKKHGQTILGIDACSSGPWFTGWSDRTPRADSPLPRATSWLLTSWSTKVARISVHELPRGGKPWDPSCLAPAPS